MGVYKFDKSFELFERAVKVIPGGVYGHRHPGFFVPGSYPYYVSRAEGCHFWDVDGNEYIDYMCAFGPIVLGYNYPPLEMEMDKWRKKGDAFNLPGEIMVELAEYLTGLITGADWVVFGKNGSDAVTFALQVAREYTERKKVIVAKGAYHGSHPWCTPGQGGILKEEKMYTLSFKFNDLEGLKKLVSENKKEVAAIVITPHHHPVFCDSELPSKEFLEGIEKLCKDEGIIFISDDIRDGFRLDLRGSHEYFGFKPHLIAFGKAMANGYPISACAGTEELKEAATRIYFTGTFHLSTLPMAASLTTLKELKEKKVTEHLFKMGSILAKGLIKLGEEHGQEIKITGPPPIPFMRFADDKDLFKSQLFCAEACKRGIYFHPHHNWFLSFAHTEEDIKKSLEVADVAFKIVEEEFGKK